MSIDRSLKSDSAISKHRNVLRRAERIARLKEEERWTDDHSAYGLSKVASRKIKVGAKTEKKAADGAAEEGDAKTEEPKT